MNELIHVNRNAAAIRRTLLAGASAIALTAYISSTDFAKAEDADHPQVWVELSGQLEILRGMFGGPVTAPFLLQSPTPGPFMGQSPISAQRSPRTAIDFGGKITFQPENSDWTLSASVRYGRSHARTHIHNQTGLPTVTKTHCVSFYGYSYCFTHVNAFPFQKFADTKSQRSEHHAIIDFQIGKDVGLGLMGNLSTSNVNLGVRIAQFSTRSSADIYARPDISVGYPGPKYVVGTQSWNAYFMHSHSQNSFTGVGPSVSWNGTTVIAGGENGAELVFDWGINAALLFGRQKAKTDHRTTATKFYNQHYQGTIYTPGSHHSTRSRRVAVPNLGGLMGISVRYPNAKISLGYRGDFFFGAMDTGLDLRQTRNVVFQGPFAAISVGFGG